MVVRDPRPRDERVDPTPENLAELARAYCPVLKWADGERFFPIRAESWLTHTTSAPWPPERAEMDDLPADPSRRGTAIFHDGPLSPMAWDPGPYWFTHVGGPPNPHDHPIDLDPAASGDPDAIASYREANERVFLAVGGWEPGAVRRGDERYLYALFSEQAAAIDPSNHWEPVDLEPNQPAMWVPQPVNPTVYAECQWAARYIQRAEQSGKHDFGLRSDENWHVRGYMVLTYHYLYPMRAPVDGGRRMEGQWEAASLFFPMRDFDTGEPAAERRFSEPPDAVVVSRGLERSQPQPTKTLYRPWGAVEHDRARPVLYVARGSHRFYFEATPGSRWDPNGKPKPGEAGYDPDAGDITPGDSGGSEPYLAAAAAALAAGFPLAALVLLILYLLSLCMNDNGDDPAPNPSEVDHAAGDGPQAGGGDEAPVGDGDAPGGPAATDAVTGTNAGSPTGRNTLSFDVRVVDAYNHAGAATPYPAPAGEHGLVTEYPAWWDYSGGWGIHVERHMDADWEDGMRRVDEYGRSWAYWNLQRLLYATSTGHLGD